MGIKLLNKFLLNNCTKEEIKKVSLNYLNNKTIVVDTSIFLYKFEAEDKLIENMQIMLLKFIKYKIIPIFIFDGITDFKSEIISIRQELKKKSKLKIDELENKENLSIDECIELKQLKQNIVVMSNNKIKSVKDLINKYNFKIIESKLESDQICASLLKNNCAWGCLSDDMDMFVYGCKKIIRNLDLINDTVVIYDTLLILHKLKISFTNFQTICILSGTDYFPKYTNNIFDLFKLYYDYDKHNHNNEKLLNWIIKNKKVVYDKHAFEFNIKIFNI
jgi:5'-3' exonuclease